jgi:hypothetical protein
MLMAAECGVNAGKSILGSTTVLTCSAERTYANHWADEFVQRRAYHSNP